MPRTLAALLASCLASLLATLALPGCSESDRPPVTTPASDARPNLILISLDTCRADRLGCYGAQRDNTPNVDRLAREGVRFEDCVAQSCVTAPSHMSLLTSHYVQRHGLVKNGLVSRPPYTLASVLRERGYATAAFTGHGSFQAKYGHGVGFEVFESWVGPDVWPFTRNLPEVLPRAVRWLERGRDAAQPFFLLVHGYDPHCPYWPDEPVRSEYAGWYEGALKPERICGPPQFLNLIRRGIVGPEELRYVSDLYDAEIFLADAAIGRFLDELEGRGLLDDTFVVFTSDHGESLGERNRVGHGALTPEILRVPLVIRWPGGTRRGVVDETVELVDVMPTLLAALGVEAPEGLQGLDLGPLVEGGAAPWSGGRLRIAQANDNYSVLVGKRWKLDFSLPGERPLEPRLYDLAVDPRQERDLCLEPGGRERFAELCAPFLAWRKRERPLDARLYSGGGDATSEDREMLEALGYGDGGD